MGPSCATTRALLERLVGFATVSRDSNLDLIAFVQEFLESCGVRSTLFKNAGGTKANLLASIGPQERGGVLLSGHTDVVPVDGQRWSSDPFRLSERGGALYGRGTADMKGFIASALAAVERATHRTLRAPLHLALSYDEEVGCVGVRSLIDALAAAPVKPRWCIVGEPTLLRTAVGHKGKAALEVTCRGRAAHSALATLGLNAIHLAMDFAARVRARQSALERDGPHDPAYTVPFTTLHLGRISGGVALNIVPDHCALELEIRNLPQQSTAGILAAVGEDAATAAAAAHDPDARVELELINEYPGLATPPHSELVRFAGALTGETEPIKVDFGSEAGLYSGAGIPSVLCGPGSIEQAHRPDEFVTLAQLARCDAMMDALIERLCRDPLEAAAADAHATRPPLP